MTFPNYFIGKECSSHALECIENTLSPHLIQGELEIYHYNFTISTLVKITRTASTSNAYSLKRCGFVR